MGHDSFIQTIAGVILVICIAFSVALSPAISTEAGRAQLTYSDTAQEGDPPEIALAIAMGAFRGLFVNILWIRAQELKDEGRFHESIELARAITRLQPRFPRVWGFHAWNLAYNISVATETAPERWRWVQAGIDLLRQEGIPRNPNDMQLQRELAWIFMHKVQGISDDANRYYKREMARDWTAIIGPSPPRPRIDDPDVVQFRAMLEADPNTEPEQLETHALLKESMIQRRIYALRQLEKAPDDLGPQDVYRFYNQPDVSAEFNVTMEEATGIATMIQEMIRILDEDAGLKLDINFLRTFAYRQALANSWVGSEFGMTLSDSVRNQAFDELLLDPEYEMGWRVLLPYVRKQVLTRDKNMEIARMIRYTRKYGPLDWRSPASHAVYWATRGVETGLARTNTEDFDQTNTDRIIVQSLQELFRWGDIYYNILNDSYISMVNLDFADSYGQTLKELEARATDFESLERGFRMYGMGYRNFLTDVIRVYYRMGDFKMAARYFETFKTYGGHNLNDEMYLRELMSMTLDEFVNWDLAEQLTVPQFASSEIAGSLRDAYIRGLLRGDMKIYQGQMEYAAKVHSNYMEIQNRNTIADTESRMLQIPPRFIDAASAVLVNTLVSGNVGREEAGLIWRRTPLGLRRAAYDQLLVALEGAFSRDEFDRWFPEPSGMEQYREDRRLMDLREDVLHERKKDLNIQEK